MFMESRRKLLLGPCPVGDAGAGSSWRGGEGPSPLGGDNPAVPPLALLSCCHRRGGISTSKGFWGIHTHLFLQEQYPRGSLCSLLGYHVPGAVSPSPSHPQGGEMPADPSPSRCRRCQLGCETALPQPNPTQISIGSSSSSREE